MTSRSIQWYVCLVIGLLLIHLQIGCQKNKSTANGKQRNSDKTGVVSADETDQPEEVAPQPTGLKPQPTGGHQPTAGDSKKKPFGLILEREYPDHTFSVTPLVLGERMILADYEGRVKSVRLATGDQDWQFQGDSLGYEAPAIADGGRLYAVAFEGFVDCLDLNTGDPIWNFNCDATVSAPLRIHDDILLIGTELATLICVDKMTGDEKWRFQATDQIHSAPQIVSGKILVVAACSRTMHVVDLATGEEVRQIQLPDESASPFIVAGEQVYVTTMYGDALCYDWVNARRIWSYSFNPEIQPQIGGGPIIIDDIMYVGASDSFVRALNIKTQKEVWAQRIKGTIESSLAIGNGVIFAVTPRGRIYGLSRKTGKILWKYETNGDFLDAPTIVEDTIVFVNNEGMVYRFGPISSLP
jgi:eukaryotic-like serine/threonine-protein kinase